MREYLDIQTIKERNFILAISGEPITEEDLKNGVRYIGTAPRREIELPRYVGKSPTAT